MNLWQNYLRPKTLAEAMDAFSSAPKPLAPIAGGTDLLIDLEQGRHSPVHTLIDITEIEELLALEIRDDCLFIGAGVPVNRIVMDPLAGTHAQALVEACELIGGPQVRNVATLGGNVAHALPAADGTIALLALDAQAEIASLALSGASDNERSRSANEISARRIPFIELFLGPGKSSLQYDEELLVGFYLPLVENNQSSCFKRIMRPQGVALPIINVAIWLERENDIIKDIRIAVGPGASTPWRARDAEQVLIGKSMNDETVEAVLEILLKHVGFRSSPRRASADYRRHLVEGLFNDTLESAWERAG
ncbi:MAG: FAD binding domain-containing protein [Anaerolineae bacterium]|nr:FAD binding domain-containing protein [Anaerolineae bacterium]MCI0608695.1 FAD binding domain-containing protein [Anaerolineae bacterium]